MTGGCPPESASIQRHLRLYAVAGFVLELWCGKRQVGAARAPGTRPQRRCGAAAPRGEGRLLHLGRVCSSCTLAELCQHAVCSDAPWMICCRVKLLSPRDPTLDSKMSWVGAMCWSSLRSACTDSRLPLLRCRRGHAVPRRLRCQCHTPRTKASTPRQ